MKRKNYTSNEKCQKVNTISNSEVNHFATTFVRTIATLPISNHCFVFLRLQRELCP